MKSDPDKSGEEATNPRPPRKKTRLLRGSRNGKQKAATTDDEDDDDEKTAFLSLLDRRLVRAALQPILRPWPPSAPLLSGNVSRVTNARKIVLEALRTGEVEDGWEKFVTESGPDEEQELLQEEEEVSVEEVQVERVTRAGSGRKNKSKKATESNGPALILVCPLCSGPV